MNKIQILGVVLMVAGIGLYFVLPQEPYSTIGGMLSGVGFVGLFFTNTLTKRLLK